MSHKNRILIILGEIFIIYGMMMDTFHRAGMHPNFSGGPTTWFLMIIGLIIGGIGVFLHMEDQRISRTDTTTFGKVVAFFHIILFGEIGYASSIGVPLEKIVHAIFLWALVTIIFYLAVSKRQAIKEPVPES